MNKITAMLTVLLMLVFASLVKAQSKEVLRQRVIDSVRKNQKRWKLTDSTSLSGMQLIGVDSVYANWEYGKSRVDVMILIYSSLDRAKGDYPTAFQTCPDCFVEKMPLTTRMGNLGDENRMWEDRNLHHTGIIFRSGKILVAVEASSMSMAKKLARYVVREIARGE